jgi:hypothetical protein
MTLPSNIQIVIGENRLQSNSYMSDGVVIYQLNEQTNVPGVFLEEFEGEEWEECNESDERISVQTPGLRGAEEIECYCQLYKKTEENQETEYREIFIADGNALGLDTYFNQYC